MTAFAFVLTTAIITANESMDLFHALCLYWLISILVASSIRPMRLISAYKDARQAVQLVFFLLTLTGLMAYTTYRHATEPTFGNRAECNSHIIIACFGRGRPAVDSDRLVLLGLAATTSALEFIALCCFALSYVLLNCCGSGNHDEGTSKNTQVVNRSSRKRRVIRKALFGVSTFFWVDTIIGIVTIERTIRANHLGPGLGEWTFGQVLAMAMLLGPLFEIGCLVLGKWKERGVLKNEFDRDDDSQLAENGKKQLSRDNNVQFIGVAL